MAGIYEAIIGVMADVGAIEKDKKNVKQGFKYRGIDDVMNALQPAMVKREIFVVPTILEQKREERRTGSGGTLLYSICTIKYTFFAKDGSSVEAIVIGEGMDSGDKATNKAMSIAFKYACFQVFCIPTEEMKDPDADTPEQSTKKQEDKDTRLKNAEKAVWDALLQLMDGNKDAVTNYWNEHISKDTNSLEAMTQHYKAIHAKLELMQHA